MRRPLTALLVALALGTAMPAAHAETLPLPANLIALDSPEGAALLDGAEEKDDFIPLSMHFVTQVHPAFCGVASLVMVLNALQLPAPASPMTTGIGMFDQENVFTAATEGVRPRAAIEQGGMTLEQFSGLLGSYGLKAAFHHAADRDLDAFRKDAIAWIDGRDTYVIVNYLRSALGQKTYGHISPLAAYDADTDRFLILDVTRYKYPPIWVTAADLFASMNTTDSDAGGKTRGYVLVGR
jgi:hypothetical protein